MHKNSSRILLHMTSEDCFRDRSTGKYTPSSLSSVQCTRIVSPRLADVLLTVVGLAQATENYGMSTVSALLSTYVNSDG
jgi:hypothetical protein